MDGVGGEELRMATITPIDQLDATPHAVVFPGEEPKTIRLSLTAGESVPSHRHPDREVVLYLIAGGLELELDGACHRLETGDIAHFDGAQDISPTATDDSIAIIILSPKGENPESG